MNKSLIFSFTVLFLIPIMTMDVFAVVEFSENFDAIGNAFPLDGPGFVSPGWTQVACEESGFDTCPSACVTTWDIMQSPSIVPPSLDNWGQVHIEGGSGSPTDNFQICQNTFSVSVSGNYDVSAILGANACNFCKQEARLYIYDSALARPGPLFQHFSPDVQATNPVDTDPATEAFATQVALTSGITYNIEIEARLASPGVFSGPIRAYFDDILVESNLPVGSLSIPIDNTVLFVTSVPSIPLWLAPLALSAAVAGAGLVLIRKS